MKYYIEVTISDKDIADIVARSTSKIELLIYGRDTFRPCMLIEQFALMENYIAVNCFVSIEKIFRQGKNFIICGLFCTSSNISELNFSLYHSEKNMYYKFKDFKQKITKLNSIEKSNNKEIEVYFTYDFNCNYK